MTIRKDNHIYTVSETEKLWVFKEECGALSVEYRIDKALCQTEAELRKYVESVM